MCVDFCGCSQITLFIIPLHILIYVDILIYSIASYVCSSELIYT